MFSIPGGHVEDSDLNILHGLKREVFEETNMLVQRVLDQIDPLAWVTVRSVQAEDKATVSKLTNLQIMFVCDVKDDTLRVDPEEHSEGLWADKEEAEKLNMSTGMRRVVESAFMWKEADVNEGWKL